MVACFDQYPFSLACALMGMEQLMLALCDDRPLVEAFIGSLRGVRRGLRERLAEAGRRHAQRRRLARRIDRSSTLSRGGLAG